MNNASETIANTLVSADFAEARGDFAHLPEAQIDTLMRGLQKLHTGDETGAAAVSSILDRNVRMPIYRWDDAKNAFDILARKAAARSLPVPVLEEVSRETVGEGPKAEVWITARLLGAAPVLNGWRCVATLTEIVDRDPETGEPIPGTIITHVASGQTFEDEGASMRCDHCGFNRKRQLVFVLRNEEGGKEMFVGSTCLNEYLGTDALGAWFVWSRLHELSKRMDGWNLWSLADHASWLADHPEAIVKKDGSNRPPIPVDKFMAACVTEIDAHGYLSKGELRKIDRHSQSEMEVLPTGQKVWHSYQTGEHVSPTMDDHAHAERVIAWIGTLNPEEIDRRNYEPTWHASLALALGRSRTGVCLRDACLMASGFSAHKRELERRRSIAEWTQGWLPGQSGDPVVLTLKVRRSLYWALACADERGRQVLLKVYGYKKTKEPIKIGDEVLVSAKIHSFIEYHGQTQTLLQRASVYPAQSKPSSAICKKARGMFERLNEPVPEWAQPRRKAKA